jgi:hypothetical protein
MAPLERSNRSIFAWQPGLGSPCMGNRNQLCDSVKINKCFHDIHAVMEAAFLIQPWIATRTITDYCRLCHQSRDGTDFLACKRAHLAGFNSLLASLRMEPNPQFGNTFKLLEDAKETCLSTGIPDDQCHQKMQGALLHTQELYDQMLDEYKHRYAVITAKPSSNPPM